MTVVVVAAVIEEAGHFLLTRRKEGTHMAGLWEFPGGKVDPAEPHADALRREMREELDVDVVVGEQVYNVVFPYEDRVVELHFYRCILDGTPRPLLGQEMAWVASGNLRFAAVSGRGP